MPFVLPPSQLAQRGLNQSVERQVGLSQICPTKQVTKSSLVMLLHFLALWGQHCIRLSSVGHHATSAFSSFLSKFSSPQPSLSHPFLSLQLPAAQAQFLFNQVSCSACKSGHNSSGMLNIATLYFFSLFPCYLFHLVSIIWQCLHRHGEVTNQLRCITVKDEQAKSVCYKNVTT